MPLFYERWQGPVPRALGAPGEALARHARPVRHRRPHGARLRRAALRAHRRRRPTRSRADGYAAARELAAWKARVAAGWHGVHVDDVETRRRRWPTSAPSAPVAAVVALGDLGPDDVEVQLLHGPVGQDDELAEPEVVVAWTPAGAADDGHLRYRGRFTCERAGRYGFTVRVVPAHPDLVTPVELGHIAWA